MYTAGAVHGKIATGNGQSTRVARWKDAFGRLQLSLGRRFPAVSARWRSQVGLSAPSADGIDGMVASSGRSFHLPLVDVDVYCVIDYWIDFLMC